MKQTAVIHYHEINLKKNNRSRFENRLKLHLEALLQDLEHEGVHRFAGRMLVALNEKSPLKEIERRLRTAFGIANFAFAWELEADLDAIRTGVLKLLQDRRFHSFRIDARRGTKEFPLNSQQVNVDLGAVVRTQTGAAVDLENPDLTCYVEIVAGRTFIYFEKLRGGGGLPSGTGGRVMCLLSGGIDSPVAAFRLLRRGCQVHFVHFHSLPHTTNESLEKVRRIVEILSRYQLHSKLYMVPFAELQREIVAYAPPALRVLLYRRFMMRIAERLALKQKASALVTGDSLGQVASQTLENLRAVSSVVSLPIFRPLIGDDKEDIIRLAREIGTYEISILPDQDCCTLFVPKHPETMASIEQLERAEEALDVQALLQRSLESVSLESIRTDLSPAPALPPGR